MSSPSSNSSSSDPDYHVAASDLDYDAAAVVPPRRADAEDYVSFLCTQDEVDAVCEKYGVPKDRYAARPAGDLRASSSPPPGAVCVYAGALEAGLRVPLHPFFREVLAHFGLAPTQLAPNGWRTMAGFVVLCHLAGVSLPLLAVFRHFFRLVVLNLKRRGWYYFRSKDTSGLRFTGLPHEIKDWKHAFFFLSSPAPWPCSVEWDEPSKISLMDPVLSAEDKKLAAKLLRAHGGSPVDLGAYLCSSNLSAAMISPVPESLSPQPPPSYTPAATDSKGMDPSVYDMMKTMLAEKMARQASASAKKVKTEPGSSSLCGKKGSPDEANGEEGRPPSSDAPPAARGHLVPTSVCSPLPGILREPRDFADGDGTDWEAARELLQGAVAPPQQRVFAATEPSDVVASSYVAILQAANYVSFSLDYALELEEKLLAREAEIAALRMQLEETNGELAQAKVPRR
ncbi:unnamed protein product [Triticum turgidum subsp. durum]|uniref:Transposase (putative) gypsy type domain-containing protein n=1 Tax=Triticum turgidum subsp. durum TaxID=4567 RepID=A0A9R0Z613_TRITD|nr:unnamed protein product [Triticum turgidum subsp. durum]